MHLTYTGQRVRAPRKNDRKQNTSAARCVVFRSGIEFWISQIIGSGLASDAPPIFHFRSTKRGRTRPGTKALFFQIPMVLREMPDRLDFLDPGKSLELLKLLVRFAQEPKMGLES